MHLNASSIYNFGVLFENPGLAPLHIFIARYSSCAKLLNGCWPVDTTDIRTPKLYTSDAIVYGFSFKTSGAIYGSTPHISFLFDADVWLASHDNPKSVIHVHIFSLY